MPRKRDPAYLMAQAAKCRRLACSTPDEIAARELLALAIELETEANSEAMPSDQPGELVAPAIKGISTAL